MCRKLPQTHCDSMCFSFLSSLTGSCSKWATESKHNQVPQLTIHWTAGQSPPPSCWEINSEVKRVKIKFTLLSFLCSDNSSPWRPTGTIHLPVKKWAAVPGSTAHLPVTQGEYGDAVEGHQSVWALAVSAEVFVQRATEQSGRSC